MVDLVVGEPRASLELGGGLRQQRSVHDVVGGVHLATQATLQARRGEGINHMSFWSGRWSIRLSSFVKSLSLSATLDCNLQCLSQPMVLVDEGEGNTECHQSTNKQGEFEQIRVAESELNRHLALNGLDEPISGKGQEKS